MTEPNTALPEGTALPSETLKILNTPMLIMGPSKSGKSSLLSTAAEYVFETYGKVTLLYLTDGGGFPLQVQSLVNLGIIWLWKLRSRSGMNLAHDTMQRAAEGYWPAEIDPKTGETAPNVRLVPPMTTKISMLCPNGHTVKVVAHAAQLKDAVTCPTCKTVVTAQNMHTASVSTPTKGFEQVGARMYDGISSMMSWGAEDLAARSGRMELTGEKSALGGTVESGDLRLAGGNRAQVGFMQTRAQQLILLSGSVTGMVIPPIWTALTQEGSDEGGLRIRGPQIIGQARTAEAPQWFGDAIETAKVTTGEGTFRRMYLNQFTDTDGIRHLCGVRSFPGMLPPYLEDPDNGSAEDVPFVNFNLGKFFQLREAARQKTEEQYRAKYQNAPGLPSGRMGETEPVAAAPTPASAPAAQPRPTVAAPRPVAAKPTAAAPVTPTAISRPAVSTPTVPPTAAAAGSAPTPAKPAPSPAVTGPVAAQPSAPKPPARGPVSAPPPGRRPQPAPAVARPVAAAPKTT